MGKAFKAPRSTQRSELKVWGNTWRLPRLYIPYISIDCSVSKSTCFAAPPLVWVTVIVTSDKRHVSGQLCCNGTPTWHVCIIACDVFALHPWFPGRHNAFHPWFPRCLSDAQDDDCPLLKRSFCQNKIFHQEMVFLWACKEQDIPVGMPHIIFIYCTNLEFPPTKNLTKQYLRLQGGPPTIVVNGVMGPL